MSETQRQILNQTGVSQSQYIQHIASMHSHINNTNEGIKNSNYDRYLNRKKGKVLSNQGKSIVSEPVVGNKTQSVHFTSKNNSDCSTFFCN
jgi:hypothetical protein